MMPSATVSILAVVQCHLRIESVMQEDLETVKSAGDGRVDVTVGSALDIFGGELPFQAVVEWHRLQTPQ